jgi:hypothetical protein
MYGLFGGTTQSRQENELILKQENIKNASMEQEI